MYAYMNKFKEYWLKTKSIPGNRKDQVIDLHKRGWTIDRIADEIGFSMSEIKEFLIERGLEKSIPGYIEKPGESIHSQKWDDCVADVGQDVSVNAFAVCTAQLGEASFKSFDNMTKSELHKAQEEIKEAMGIEYAGPIPNSLLAEQDLETTKSGVKRAGDVVTGEYLDQGRVVSVSKYEAGNRCIVSIVCKDDMGNINELTYDVNDMTLTKSSEDKYEITNSQQNFEAIEDIGEDGKDVSDTEEKNMLVDKLKQIQLKRQQTEINTRKAIQPGFKDFWKRSNYGKK